MTFGIQAHFSFKGERRKGEKGERKAGMEKGKEESLEEW